MISHLQRGKPNSVIFWDILKEELIINIIFFTLEKKIVNEMKLFQFFVHMMFM
ncbi:hypothetical protein PGB90_003673 [Kerria lacca]